MTSRGHVAGFALMMLVGAACGSAEPVSEVVSLDTESFEEMDSVELSVEEINGIVSGSIAQPEFNSEPATSGPYADVWARCGIYRQPIPDIYQVHSLRRGAVVINYQPSLERAEVAVIEELVVAIGGEVLAAPHPGLDQPVVLSAWTKLLALDEVDGTMIRAFVEQFGQSAPDNRQCALEIDEATG